MRGRKDLCASDVAGLRFYLRNFGMAGERNIAGIG
jgi:hypothetical protein